MAQDDAGDKTPTKVSLSESGVAAVTRVSLSDMGPETTELI